MTLPPAAGDPVQLQSPAVQAAFGEAESVRERTALNFFVPPMKKGKNAEELVEESL